MHGWQFELATGRCLTSDDRKLYAQKLASDGTDESEKVEEQAQQEPVEEWIKPPTYQCGHCLYVPYEERKAAKQP